MKTRNISIILIILLILINHQSKGQNRTLDTSLPVGTTTGSFNVSSTGDATYSVPIPVPPGTAGMQPSISVNYNSSFGNGILGIGWSLGAVSAITRVQSDFYHDGFVDEIDFDSYDRFAMDGNRLILNSGIYGFDNSVYFTESETFARITAMNSTGNGPQWFRVETKNGNVLEYGYTADSRIEGVDRTDVLIWYLNKITDVNGNYITYTYHTDKTNGEYWLERIDYTGNATTGLSPYNAVVFSYQARKDIITNYIYGTPFKNSKYLSKIETYNEALKVREFQFEYVNNEILNLTEIYEYGKDGTRLNSTHVNWYANAKGNDILPSLTYTTDVKIADFNGNGKDEILVLSDMNIFELNPGGTDLVNLGPSNIPSCTKEEIQTGDFNGDGKIDIVTSLSNDSNAFQYYQNSATAFSLIGSYGPASTSATQIYAHDYNGDGIDDILMRNPANGTILVYWGNESSPFSSNTSLNIYWSTKQFFYDFDGNGKIEIMSSGYIYEWDENSFQLKQTLTGATSTKKYFFGDYNGDGKTDIIYGTYSSLNNNLTNISSCISTGNGFIITAFGHTIEGEPDNISVYDYDYDGKDELNFFKLYNPTGTAYKFYNFTYIAIDGYEPVLSNLGDYNGDGIQDYFNLLSGDLFFPYRSNTKDLVSSITNGLNDSINITYEPITDVTVYTPLNNGVYKKIDYTNPFYIVSQVNYSNGLDNQNQIDYTYTGAKFNNQSKYFIGFTSITQIDNTQDIKLKKTFEVNNTYFFNSLKKTETFDSDNVLLYESNYAFNTKDYGNSRFFAYLSQQTNIDYLHSNATSSASYNYNNDGNLITANIIKGGTSSYATNTYGTYGGWCENRLLTTSTTSQRDDEPAYTSSASFQYNSNGQLLQKINEPGNFKQVYTNYEYYPTGNVWKVKISPDGITGRTETMEYDAKYRLVTKTLNTEGHFVENTYDWGLGVPTSTKDHNNLTSSYVYDGFGRLIQTTGPDGNISTMVYTWVTDNTPQYALYKVTATIPGIPAASTWYDKLGRAILTEGAGIDGTKIFSETSWNTRGQTEYITLPYYQGQSNTDRKTFGYDPLGRLISETAPGMNMTYAYNGLTTTITDHIKGQTYTREADATGVLINASDAGGNISYAYNSQEQTKEINTAGNIITMTYDQFGRQTSLIDPNTGTYSYEYNVYGQLTKQTDPLMRETNLVYDNIGRITNCNQSTFNTTFTYKTNGLPDAINATNGTGYSFNYDALLRPQQSSETINSQTLNTSYTYDDYGRIAKVTYPEGFEVTYHYKNGYLEELKRADNGQSIWKVNSVNSKGQITQSTSGNGLVTTKTYKNSGELLTIVTGTSGSVQNLAYSYNSKGLMEWRKDIRNNNITETFGYDNLNRLTSIAFGAEVKNIGYGSNGNITSQTGVGTYTYNAQKPNAVEKISSNPASVSNVQQDITYTSFSKIEEITEGSNSTTFTYGPDYSRKYTEAVLNGKNVEMYYSGSYEREIVNGTTRHLYYIVAYGQIVAIFEKKSTGDAMHYVHTDHLGSLNVITNSAGAIEQELSYDAWGNRRNPATWVNLTTAPSNLITNRGFTAHEHMDAFGLINMNGRLYDPKLGRFLSPDPFVANLTSTQDYNRYSYVVNNPLMFTDPSGYQLHPKQPLKWDWRMEYNGGAGCGFGWSEESIFPKMGMISSPGNGLMYAIAFGNNIGAQTGDYSYLNAIRSGVENGNYNGNGVEYYQGDAARIVGYSLLGANVTGVRSSRSVSGGYEADDNGNYGVYSILFNGSLKIVLGGWIDGAGNGVSNVAQGVNYEIPGIIDLSTSISGIYGDIKNKHLNEELANRRNLLKPFKQNLNGRKGTTTWLNPTTVKWAKLASFTGLVGDGISLSLAFRNCVWGEGWTLVNTSDLIFSGIGAIPIGGDIISIFYIMGKDRMNEVRTCSDLSQRIQMWDAATMVNCFVEGTRVLMANGNYKSIELVQINDTVLTYNINEKRFEGNPVIKIDDPIHHKVIKIIFSNGEEITSTEDHPYYVKGKGWSSFKPEITFQNYGIKTEKLEVFDFCLTINRNKLRKVKVLQIIPFEKSVKTYNLTKIAKSNNYFVNGILVNNESKSN